MNKFEVQLIFHLLMGLTSNPVFMLDNDGGEPILDTDGIIQHAQKLLEGMGFNRDLSRLKDDLEAFVEQDKMGI